jgi:hypothetical protein
MKFDVHLYIPCRIKFEGIEASSQEDAIHMAKAKFQPSDWFQSDDNTVDAVWDEAPPLGALVDEVGDVDFLRSHYYELESAELYRRQSGKVKLRG